MMVDHLVETAVQIYPNPVKDFINLSITDKALLQTDINIFDLNGKNILSQRILNSQQIIDVSKLISGIYIIRFENGDNIKIIKQ